VARHKERRGAYVANELQLEITGHWRRARGQVPIIFCRGFLANGWTLRRGAGAVRGIDYFRPWAEIADQLGCVVLGADLGGASTWATDTVVGAAGRIDTLLSWAGTNLACRTDRVIITGDSMGSLEALNWAWRNHVKVVAIYVRAPIVRFEGFYNANPALQGAIDAAWTTHPGFLAGLPTHDPAQNMAALGHLGHKTLLQYTGQDELIPPTWVVDYATATGATLHYGHGNHEANVYAPGLPVAEWLADRLKSAA
jgi:hypothetical protein